MHIFVIHLHYAILQNGVVWSFCISVKINVWQSLQKLMFELTTIYIRNNCHYDKVNISLHIMRIKIYFSLNKFDRVHHVYHLLCIDINMVNYMLCIHIDGHVVCRAWNYTRLNMNTLAVLAISMAWMPSHLK